MMKAYKLMPEEVIPKLSPLGLMFIDFEDRHLLLSDGPLQKAHYVSDKVFRQMVEDAFYELLCKEDVPVFNASLVELLASDVGEPVELICRTNVKGQGLRWVHFQAMILEKNEEGKPLKLICCGKDITGAKKLEHKLEKKTRQIEQLNEVRKETLIAPVSSVLELVEMLKGRKLGYKLDQMIIQHLEAILKNLYQNLILR